MKHVAVVADVAELAGQILGERTKPLVLISSTDDGGFAFDPDHIARELGDEATVITVATGPVTKALERLLPEKTHAFGGAARSYPPDFGASPVWQRSILRFPARSDADDLIDDALAQIATGHDTSVRVVPAHVPQPSPHRLWARGSIEFVSGSSGNVALLDDARRVMIIADLIPPEFPWATALRVGDPIAGWLSGRDLAPEAADVDTTSLTLGTVLLGRVVKVTDARVTLCVHPSLPEVVLRRRDVVPGADDGENVDVCIPDLVHVGQTVRARVTATHPALTLSLIDVDPDAGMVEAFPLLRDGAPWLREGEDHSDDVPPAGPADPETPHPPAPASAAAASEPARAPDAPASATLSVELGHLRDEIVELRAAFGRLARDVRAGSDLETLERLRDEAAATSAELARERGNRRERDRMIARLNHELRDARAARADAAGPRHTPREAWPSADDWVRHEIRAAWALRTTASEKQSHPLGDVAIGPRFADSLGALDDAQFAKAMRAVVDVVTGRAADVPGRELHQLRTSAGGNDPQVERPDGAKAWRAAIESHAPSARRLHYWRLPGGGIELSRVVLHDDVEP